MARTQVSRTIAASQQELWNVVSDPHHLSRWWPRVERVEAIAATSFTEVLLTAKGRPVRADFTIVEAVAPRLARWRQELPGTPFARFLSAAETELRLEPAPGGGTDVTLFVTETPNGLLTRLGAIMMRRAAQRRLGDALDGLTRIVG